MSTRVENFRSNGPDSWDFIRQCTDLKVKTTLYSKITQDRSQRTFQKFNFKGHTQIASKPSLDTLSFYEKV